MQSQWDPSSIQQTVEDAVQRAVAEAVSHLIEELRRTAASHRTTDTDTWSQRQEDNPGHNLEPAANPTTYW